MAENNADTLKRLGTLEGAIANAPTHKHIAEVRRDFEERALRNEDRMRTWLEEHAKLQRESTRRDVESAFGLYQQSTRDLVKGIVEELVDDAVKKVEPTKPKPILTRENVIMAGAALLLLFLINPDLAAAFIDLIK